MLRAKEEHPPRFLAKTQLHLGMKIQAHFSSWKKEWFLIKADYGVYCMCVCVCCWVCTMVMLADVQSCSDTKEPVFTPNPRAPALPGI